MKERYLEWLESQYDLEDNCDDRFAWEAAQDADDERARAAGHYEGTV